jgi:exodeoxyribonuclease III
MKIVSFNANGIRARLPVLLKWLEKEAPDVLCIQETKVQDPDFPKQPFEEAGYCCTFRGEKKYNGVAVLSRKHPRSAGFGFREDKDDESTRLAHVAIDGISIVNTYVPQGQDPESEKFAYKLEWFSRLKNYFETHFRPTDPLLWLGDFNVAPDPIDVYDADEVHGHIGYHPEEHKTLADVKKWGFVDVYRRHQPDTKEFTFWDYRIRNAVKRGIGWRIDHIWATAPLAGRSTSAWIDVAPRLWERPSDHTFLVAEFDI